MNKLALPLAIASCLTLAASSVSAEVRDPLGGWEVLQDDFQQGALDFAAYEWEYFTVQNEDGSFVGMVGYVIADPRGVLSDAPIALVPPGGSVAVSGIRPGESAKAEFLTFGLEGTTASADEKSMYVADPDSDSFAYIAPAPGATSANPALVLVGRSAEYEWDLTVRPDFLEYLPLRENGADQAFSAVRGDDVGLLPGENWTIDAVWPRTRVEGTFTERSTGEVIPVAAKGYRENSFGNYLLSVDGWDFAVFSDTEKRVQTMLQTYHRSSTIDYFDISFPDEGGDPQNVRFRANRGELGWYHPKWTFDSRARQCVPERTWMIADNGEYRVEMEVRMEEQATVPYAPFLNTETLGTKIFYIMEQYPTLDGVIRRADTGAVITTFAGQAGGEFASPKALASWRSDFGCWLTNSGKYSNPFPN